MGSEVLVTLLVPAVLGDEVQVLATEDDGVGHLAGGVDDTGEDTATDGDIAGEGALLVNVGAVDGLWMLVCSNVGMGGSLLVLRSAANPLYWTPSNSLQNPTKPPIPSCYSPEGVLKPRPTSLYQRLVLVAIFLPPLDLAFWKRCCLR